jgi:hypothetical protein
MKWFERAVREHEEAHGPSGAAWNLSAVLDCLRRAEPTPKIEDLLSEFAGIARGIGVYLDRVQVAEKLLKDYDEKREAR